MENCSTKKKVAPWQDSSAQSTPKLGAGVHDALGARLAEEAGFDLIWASGLGLCTSRGFPDASVLGMMDYLHAAVDINLATSLPVLCDCDAGFGDIVSIQQLILRYEAAGLAGVCIEDKRHPKLNSFLESSSSALETIDAFSRKLEIAVRTRHRASFGLIARNESLALGAEVDDALRRSHAYVDAGADSVVVHTKGNSEAPILDFLRRWQRRAPIILIPTTYTLKANEALSDLGVSLVIFANHGLRSAVLAMSHTFGRIVKDRCDCAVRESIAPLESILRIHINASSLRRNLVCRQPKE